MRKGFVVYAMVFSAVQLFLLLIIVGWDLDDQRIESAMSQWPTTSGTIVEAWNADQGDNPEASTPLISHIVYQYSVEGRTYHGSRVQYDESETNTSLFVQDHPVDSRIDVYYDPQRPAVAVAHTDASWSTSQLIFAGVWCAGTALLFAWAVWANSTRSQNPIGPAPDDVQRSITAQASPDSGNRENIWSGRS